MKARMIRVAGLLFAGTMAFTVAYMNPKAQEDAAKAEGGVRAGVSSELYEKMGADVGNTTLSAGAMGMVASYLSSAGDTAVAQVAETDAVMTAAPQAQQEQPQPEAVPTAAFGYTNLGVASVDGNLNVR